MRSPHPKYTPGPWHRWFAWHKALLADKPGEQALFELVWRKQIPYHFKYRKYPNGDTTQQKQWWIYAENKDKIHFYNDWEYEIL